MKFLIPNQSIFDEKIKQIKEGSITNLHVVADFDKTLTYSKVNGVAANTAIAAFRDGGFLGDEYSKKAYELFNIYHPIEIDQTIPLQEKISAMQEWWTRHRNLLLKYDLNRDIVKKVASSERIVLRSGVKDFFTTCYQLDVPVLILSAGVGDLIEGKLSHENIFYENVKVVSNFFVYDSSGKVIANSPHLIHVLNKHEVEIDDSSYKAKISSRKNVILLGDSLGDVGMVDGSSHNVVLRIGFLNGLHDSLPMFEKSFDCILLEDEGFDDVLELFNSLV